MNIVFITTFSILNILLLNYASVQYSIVPGSKRHILLLFSSLILEIITSILIIKTTNKKIAIEKLFLILFIPIGLIYMLAIPIGRVPDEGTHLTRAYGISIGHLVTSPNENNQFGENLPAELAKLNRNNSSYNSFIESISKPNENEEIFTNDSGSSLYAFVNYIPQSLGMAIGRILHLPIILTAYLGRLFNFCIFVLLFYFAIKKAPFGKTFLFFIAFLPITLQEAISLSADCLAISSTAALVSYSLYLIYDTSSKLTKKNYILLLIIIFIESLCKIVYLPLCLLIFLIPVSKFRNKKDYLLRTILPIIGVIIINLIWLKIASGYLIENNPGVNSAEQISFVLHNPLQYLQIIFNTCIASMQQFAYGIFGGWLEWLDVEIGHIYFVLSIIISSILVYKCSDIKLSIPTIHRLSFIGIAVIIINLIFASLYIQWNPVGSGFIGGLQGRYFLPVLFLAPAIACGLRKKPRTNLKNDSDNHSLLYLFSIFQSFAGIIVIICSHLSGL